MSSDEETAAYVEELERRSDEIDEDDLPTGDALAEQLTRFLREQDDADDDGPDVARGQ